MPDQPTVAPLLQRAAAGDAQAWDALVDRYTSLLWSVARAHRLDVVDAADVVQTTWLRLLEHLDRIAEPERLAGWLATTARRECLRVLRKGGREQPAPDDALDQADPRHLDLDARLLLDERDAALWACFTQLSERCQQLLRVLVAAEPPSYAEVSQALGLPVGSIGPTRGRCLSRLRELAGGSGLVLQP